MSTKAIVIYLLVIGAIIVGVYFGIKHVTNKKAGLGGTETMQVKIWIDNADLPANLEARKKLMNILCTQLDDRITGDGAKVLDKNVGPSLDYVIYNIEAIDDTGRLCRLLEHRGKFEFYNTYEVYELGPIFGDASTKLGELIKANPRLMDELGSTIDTSAESNNLFKDDKTGENPVPYKGEKQEADHLNPNPFVGIFTLNIVPDKNGAYKYGEGAALGYSKTTDTAMVNKYFSLKEMQAMLPGGLKLFWGAEPYDKAKTYVALYTIQQPQQFEEAPLSGDFIQDAYATEDESGGPEVLISMNSMGAAKWERMTAQASGSNPKRCIAIVLDGKVLSAPRVQSVITGGKSAITGVASLEEARDLALSIKLGMLTVPIRLEHLNP